MNFFDKGRLAVDLARQLGPRHVLTRGIPVWRDLKNYIDMATTAGTALGHLRLDPRTADSGPSHPLTKTVLEVGFAADVVRSVRPPKVVDVGSSLVFSTVLSAFVDVTVVDTRSITLQRSGMTVVQGDARHLPFDAQSCGFLTSLCVAEHIGLGRYGDALDSEGDLRFVQELRRCLKSDGHLVLSVPVAREHATVFNSHRVYSPTTVQRLISGFAVFKETYAVAGVGYLDRLDDRHAYSVWIAHLRPC